MFSLTMELNWKSKIKRAQGNLQIFGNYVARFYIMHASKKKNQQENQKELNLDENEILIQSV